MRYKVPRVFVTGAPRSGTTFVRKVIGNHPDLNEVKDETNLFRTDYFTNLINSPQPKYDLERFLKVFDNFYWERQVPWAGEWNPGLHNCISRNTVDQALLYLKKNYNQDNQIECLRKFLDLMFLGDKASWVEKTPLHCHSIKEIRSVYPDAIILYTMRDLRKIEQSLPEQDWFRALNFSPRSYIKAIINKAEEEIDSKVIRVLLEDFIEDPQPFFDQMAVQGLPKDGFKHCLAVYNNIADKGLVYRTKKTSDRRVN